MTISNLLKTSDYKRFLDKLRVPLHDNALFCKQKFEDNQEQLLDIFPSNRKKFTPAHRPLTIY